MVENITNVERIEGDEDQIKLNEQLLEEAINEKLEYTTSSEYEKMLVQEALESINNKIEDMLDISAFDRGEIDAKDGGELEYESVRSISDKLNHIIHNYASGETQNIQNFEKELDELAESNQEQDPILSGIKETLANIERKDPTIENAKLAYSNHNQRTQNAYNNFSE